MRGPWEGGIIWKVGSEDDLKTGFEGVDVAAGEHAFHKAVVDSGV